MTKQSITDNLRKQLSAIEDQQIELIAERDEISYLALVERDRKATERLTAINTEIERLKIQAASIEPALREAVRREVAAAEEAMAAKRRKDAIHVEGVLSEAEALAVKMDQAMATLKKDAIAFEEKMTFVRRLSGAGPQHPHLRGLLSRAISAGLFGLPQHPHVLAPNERRSVSSIATAWALQVRNRINNIMNAAKAA